MSLSGQFRACLFIYLFIYLKNDFEHKKAPKRKTNDFHPLRRFCAHKNCGLCCLVFA